MTDFRDPDPRMRDVDPRVRDYDDRYATASTPPWGWIAGAIFVFLVLAVIFSWGGNGSRTASTTASPPATTTGAAPNAPRPAPAPVTPAPAPQTTPGTGSSQ
jgi:hypothetical protein